MDPWTKIPVGPRWTNGHGRAARSSGMASGRLRAWFLAVGAPRGWGIRGEPHHGVGGRRAARFGRATVDRRGGQSFSIGQCLEHGERELGVGLDAVERWGALGRFI
jgi:hypothetical protein